MINRMLLIFEIVKFPFLDGDVPHSLLKTLLQQGISEPVFNSYLVNKFQRIDGKPNFSDLINQFVGT